MVCVNWPQVKVPISEVEYGKCSPGGHVTVCVVWCECLCNRKVASGGEQIKDYGQDS